MKKLFEMIFKSKSQKKFVSMEDACRNASGDMCIYCKTESIHKLNS